MNLKKYFQLISLILISLLFFYCSKDGGDGPTGPANKPTMEKETRSGSLKISQGSTLEEDDLEVVTFAASSDLNQDGSFSVQANEAENYQILFFNSKTTNNPVYLGLYDPLEKKIMANDTSTALSLTLFNLNLIYTDQFQRNEYLNAIKQSTKFSQLLSLLNSAYKSDANSALDYNTNSETYQVAAQLMKEALENLGGSGVLKKSNFSTIDPPFIIDAAGANITFVNPRHVWYAAGVYPNAGGLSDVATIYRKQTILSFNWGWPPVVTTDPKETNYKLGDGYFKISITKGGDFSKITQWNDPVGRATICNTAQMVVYLVELVIGNMSFFLDDLIVSFPQHFHVSGDQAFAMGEAIGSLDAKNYIITFTEIFMDNLDAVAFWIWQETSSNAQHHFLSGAMNIFKKATVVFELLGYTNEQGPFIFDLIFAPRDLAYFVTQNNGKITSTEHNDPPNAEFSITPPAGIIGTVFTFDASSTTDDNDNLNNLEFRWDWESDGTWDTNYSTTKTATHQYTTEGTKIITLEVKDTGGLTATTTRSFYVGSNDLTNGLIAYYPFNGNATDETGNGHHGIVQGAALTTDKNSRSNKAYWFNGTIENIKTGINLKSLSSFTVNCWVNLDANAVPYNNVVWTTEQASSGSDFDLHCNISDHSGVWRAGLQGYRGGGRNYGIEPRYANNTIATNSWTMITCIKDDDGLRLYINGTLTDIFSKDVTAYTGENLWLGTHYQDSGWKSLKGKIDEVRIYDRPLLDTEIQALYNDY